MDQGPDQIIIRVGEQTFVFRPAEVTARIARQVRVATGGLGVLGALSALETEPDLDILAAICYAAQLQTDPDGADYAKIEASFTYADEVIMEIEDEDKDDDSPEH